MFIKEITSRALKCFHSSMVLRTVSYISDLSYAEKVSQIWSVIVNKLPEHNRRSKIVFKSSLSACGSFSSVKSHEINAKEISNDFWVKQIRRGREQKLRRRVNLISVKFSNKPRCLLPARFLSENCEFHENRPRQGNIFHDCLVVLGKLLIILSCLVVYGFILCSLICISWFFFKQPIR